MQSEFCQSCGHKTYFDTRPRFCAKCGSHFNPTSSTASSTSPPIKPRLASKRSEVEENDFEAGGPPIEDLDPNQLGVASVTIQGGTKTLQDVLASSTGNNLQNLSARPPKRDKTGKILSGKELLEESLKECSSSANNSKEVTSENDE